MYFKFQYLVWGILSSALDIVQAVTGSSVWREIPTDVCAEENGHATLTCSGDGQYEISWRKQTANGWESISSGNSILYGVCNTCQITGNHNVGQYNLKIDPVSLHNAGKYRCELFAARPYHHQARIVITYPCRDAEIKVIHGGTHQSESTYTTEEGAEMTLQCIATGCEAPCQNITWYKDDTLIPSDSDNSSEITISVSRDDHGKRISCKVGNKATQTYREDHITLVVQSEEALSTYSTKTSHDRPAIATQHESEFHIGNGGSVQEGSLHKVLLILMSIAALVNTS
ncbi:neural cell adhesion molecule 2-like isoform X2 [Ptychodera flava]|uniref:neural cell adhesion molecule 2-like isoform X2 n=1 Tax=Ptychodera flava TaxID=63121 RepID=UPI00396A4D63